MEKYKNIHIVFTYGSRKQVLCYIYEGEANMPRAIGLACCRDSDTYSEEVGRKLSLKRALSVTGFSKAKRAECWSQYREWTMTQSI